MTYYRGLRLLTRKERRPRGRGRLGSEDRSLEAEKVIEQSGLQNELHKTRTGLKHTLTTHRPADHRRIHHIRPRRRTLRTRLRPTGTRTPVKIATVGLSRRRRQPDDSGRGLLRMSLH